MRITILRHATAGHKGSSGSPDERRQLDPSGERTAHLLVPVLAKPPPRRLISSPATRCIQTLGPTAEATDLPIELWDGLGPDADVSNLIRCFTNRHFDRSVLCTHGEVMSPLLDWGTLRTLIRDSGSTRRALLAKGTGWRLRVTPRGRIIAFKHIVATTDGQWAAPREHSPAV